MVVPDSPNTLSSASEQNVVYSEHRKISRVHFLDLENFHGSIGVNQG